MRWIISPHAVDRYRERIAPEATEAEARQQLAEAAARASLLRERARTGELRYLADGLILVARVDQGKLLHIQGSGFALAREDDRCWVFTCSGIKAQLQPRAKRGAVDAVLVGGGR